MRKCIGVLVALLLNAVFMGTSSMSVAAVIYEPTCTVGQARPVAADGSEFRLDILTVPGVPSAVRHLANQATGKDYALDVYADVKRGNIPRMEGETRATVSMIGVRTSLAPKRLPYLSGMAPTGQGTQDGVCRGYVDVKIVGNRMVVDLPVKGGEHLGQVSVIFPRSVFVGIPDVLPCVTWGVPVHVPTLTRGPMKGVANTSCGMPGTKPDETIMGMRIEEDVRWTLFAGIIKIN